MSELTATVDPAGHLVMPEPIRKRAGIRPGASFKVTVAEDRIELRPVEPAVRLVRRGRLTVAVASDNLPPLTEDEVLAIRENLRGSRTAT